MCEPRKDFWLMLASHLVYALCCAGAEHREQRCQPAEQSQHIQQRKTYLLETSAVCLALGAAASLLCALACEAIALLSVVHRLLLLLVREGPPELLKAAAGAAERGDRSTLDLNRPTRLELENWFRALLLAAAFLLLGEPELCGTMLPDVDLCTCNNQC